jgi:hypothetical protein
MSSPRARLAVAALFFVGWVGYLIYLAATTTRPVVLSRPQFLAADLYVIAGLERATGKTAAPAETALVREVAWPAGAGLKKDEPIVVRNLPLCGRDFGWVGPGDYILALTKVTSKGGVHYHVTPVPRSPGFYPPGPDPETGLFPARIYPAEKGRRELNDLTAEFHP